MGKLQRYLNVLWLLIVFLALFTANWFQLVEHRNPCSYCLFQRVAMAGIGLSAIMNLRFGVRVEHYACSILFALLGLLVSYRIAPFGPFFFGYHLSTWSSMVFLGSLIGEACLLFLYSQTKVHDGQKQWGKVGKTLFLLFSLLVILNIITPLL